MKSCIVKENHNGSAVSEILWYRQMNILLLLYMDTQRVHDWYGIILNYFKTQSKSFLKILLPVPLTMIKHFFQLFKRKGEEFCHQVKVKISLGFLADFYSILFKLRYQILFHNNQPKKFSVCFNNSCFVI